jgi:hypothetical protein
MLIIDNRMDISLPYLVYMIKIANEINPIIRKIQPKTHIAKDGTSVMSYKEFFCILYF